MKPNTWKSRESESFGTPECSELDSKAQNTSPWSVLGVIGKVSKCRCPKWPRIGHLDICSPRYGQKKGRESNWQFDSRPLKVGNRPVPDVRSGSATRRWKALFEGYNIGSDLIAIQGQGEELWLSKVPGKCDIWMPLPWSNAEYTIGNKVVAYSRGPGHGESCVKVPVACPKHPRVSRNVN